MFFFKSILLIDQQMVTEVQPGEEVQTETGSKSSGAGKCVVHATWLVTMCLKSSHLERV